MTLAGGIGANRAIRNSPPIFLTKAVGTRRTVAYEGICMHFEVSIDEDSSIEVYFKT